MTLTVRLDDALQAALDRYCTATGSSKSLVVQESLARYLLSEPARAAAQPAVEPKALASSSNHRAFTDAGFIGAGLGGGGAADKAAVRARARSAIRAHRAIRALG